MVNYLSDEKVMAHRRVKKNVVLSAAKLKLKLHEMEVKTFITY